MSQLFATLRNHFFIFYSIISYGFSHESPNYEEDDEHDSQDQNQLERLFDDSNRADDNQQSRPNQNNCLKKAGKLGKNPKNEINEFLTFFVCVIDNNIKYTHLIFSLNFLSCFESSSERQFVRILNIPTRRKTVANFRNRKAGSCDNFIDV
jgi:hypothetical protein